MFENFVEIVIRVLYRQSDSIFEIEYINSIFRFELKSEGKCGTDLAIIYKGVPEEDYLEIHAGWLSVLIGLKGTIDFNIDLRNHDSSRIWDEWYVDN